MDYKAATVMTLAKADERQDKIAYSFISALIGNGEVAPVQQEEKPVEIKTGFEIMSEVEDIIIHLEELPDVM